MSGLASDAKLEVLPARKVNLAKGRNMYELDLIQREIYTVAAVRVLSCPLLDLDLDHNNPISTRM